MVHRWLPPHPNAWSLTGAAIGSGFGLFVTLFLTAEILTDPGGWRAAGALAVWLLPTLAMTGIAFVRPGVGSIIAMVGAAAFLLLNAASFIFSDWFEELENSYGPVVLAIGLMIWLPACWLGFNRPRLAGVVLLLTIIAPALVGLSLMLAGGRSGVMVSFIVLTTPFIVAGVLLLVGAALTPASVSDDVQQSA